MINFGEKYEKNPIFFHTRRFVLQKRTRHKPPQEEGMVIKMKLRNMTCIYIFNGENVLLMYKTSSRFLTKPLWCGIGGHFEENELNNPNACIIRELEEETGFIIKDIKNLTLKYITIRKKDDEIRQQYIYFADFIGKDELLKFCNEGDLAWVKTSELPKLKMSFTNTACLEHYFNISKNDSNIYCGAVKVVENKPQMCFTTLMDFKDEF